MTTYLSRERTIDELKAELEGLEATLAENPAREFIKFIPRSGKLKGELDYITVAAYRKLTGNLGHGLPSDHMPYHLALDTIAERLGYAERAKYACGCQATDLLKQDIEKALETKHLIDKYKIMLKGVSPMPEVTDTQENARNQATAPQKPAGNGRRKFEPWDEEKAKVAADAFQAEMIVLVNDGNRATDLCGLFAKYYMTAGHKMLGRILVQQAKKGG